MRLLDTRTYELYSFLNDPPPYAILSHTWGKEEVTFDLISDNVRRYQLEGWVKIVNCCWRARKDGWDWLWVDTCCIDKADSTELGEAINSMYRWYEAAEMCYAYLSDVPPRYRLSDVAGPAPRDASINPSDGNGIPWVWNFRSSKWFTRGWTLQELLAPRFLLFVDHHWTSIGSREAMAHDIQEATGIEVKYLYDTATSSVATKLSWAANRQTTREEDRAYSLLGLLGVNMPLIYGEGERAFLRLQKEFIQTQNDESVLAWGLRPMLDNEHLRARPKGGYSNAALARGPDDFERNGVVVPHAFDRRRRAFTSTNIGISLNTDIFKSSVFDGSDGDRQLYAIRLNCGREWPGREATRSPIVLIVVALDLELNLFQRHDVRVWSETDHFGWKSMDRIDVVISYNNTLEHSKLRKQARIWFRYPSAGEIRLSRAWLFDSHERVAEDNVPIADEIIVSPARGWLDSSGRFSSARLETHDEASAGLYLDKMLLPDRAMCHLISVSRSKAIWLVIKQSLRLPHVGIWTHVSGTGCVDFVKTVISLPGHLYPRTASLPDGRAGVEVSLKPLPREAHSGSPQYLLAIYVAEAESYTGEVGRFIVIGDKLREGTARAERDERYRSNREWF